MKHWFTVLCAVLVCTAAASAQEADAQAQPAGGVENLFTEVGVGWMMPEGEPTSTGLAYGAVNYGFAVSDIIKLGGQVGGKFMLRDDDPDWLVSAGLFQREVLVDGSKMAWAVQGVYQNTWAKADLLSIKPTIGLAVEEYDYIALTGVWGLNDEHIRSSTGVIATQQAVNQAMLIWGAEWSDEFRTELGAGYAFQNVDAILVGVHTGLAVDDVTSLNFTGSFDFEGNYYGGLSLGFDLGAGGRNATCNNISRKGASDYTPFPLGSLPVIFYESE